MFYPARVFQHNTTRLRLTLVHDDQVNTVSISSGQDDWPRNHSSCGACFLIADSHHITFTVVPPKATEAEMRRLRREADSDRQGLDGARQACLEREREVSSMEERLRERYLEADDVEVSCLSLE